LRDEFVAQPSPANDLNLDDFNARLAAHSAVLGIVTLGTTAADRMVAASDIDLVVVIDSSAARFDGTTLQSAVMNIDGRVGDILFTTSDELDEIMRQTGEPDPEGWASIIAPHLRNGQIVLDRTGKLRQAQRHLENAADTGHSPAGSAYNYWNSINYNLLHNRRMVVSEDPVYQTALEVRLGYCLADVLVGYLAIRGHRWQGEKAAVRFLEESDPGFLETLNRCRATTNTRQKFEVYETLCEIAVAPAGGLWPPAPASVKLRPDGAVTPEAQQAATDFLMALTAESD
jgi:hypothetical protein